MSKKPSSSIRQLDAGKVEEGTAIRPLAAYHHGGFTSEGLNFTRLYHAKGPGLRESILGRVNKKLFPAGSGAKACRARTILPPDAPDMLEDPLALATAYEANLHEDEATVCALMTFPFPEAINVQGPFQLINSWLYSEFAIKHQVGAIAVFHAPWLEGSSAAAHGHAMILTGLRVGRFGWARNPVSLACDAAAINAKQRWNEFVDAHSLR